MRARFGVVIVNYNCAQLAVDAALSAFGDGAARVAIVDNASQEGSLEQLRTVTRGGDFAPADPAGPHAVRFGGAPEAARIEILPQAVNRGFAAGVNAGLKLLREDRRLDHFLVLNPDALLGAGALAAFAARLLDSEAGLCGATVLRFDAPHTAQALGGAQLHPVTLVGENLGGGATLSDLPAPASVEPLLDYPLGAAMALRRDYLETVGYLDERYFLYYEEADWALSGAPFFRTAWAPDAVVYHRYGAASGSQPANAGERSRRSPLAEYHMARSRLLFAIKWRPWLAPLLLAAGGAQAGARIGQGRVAEARAVALGSLPGAPRAFSDVAAHQSSV